MIVFDLDISSCSSIAAYLPDVAGFLRLLHDENMVALLLEFG